MPKRGKNKLRNSHKIINKKRTKKSAIDQTKKSVLRRIIDFFKSALGIFLTLGALISIVPTYYFFIEKYFTYPHEKYIKENFSEGLPKSRCF